MCRKETNSARVGGGRKVSQKQRAALPWRSSFSPGRGCQKAMWTGMCPNGSGADGRAPFQFKFLPRFDFLGVCCFIISFKHSTIKGVHTQGLLCFSTRKWAKRKQQVTKNKYCGMFYLLGSKTLKPSEKYNPKTVSKSTRNKPLYKLLSFIFLL